jgi:hypothetical protein
MVRYLPSFKGGSNKTTVSLSCRYNSVTSDDVPCKLSRTRSARIVTGGMSRAISHSSDPLIVIFEIFRNICLDGTALILIAPLISPFSFGELKGVDSFVPVLKKKIGATTEKSDICRVKEKLARGVFVLLTPRKWRIGRGSWMTNSALIEAPYRGPEMTLRYCGAWSRRKTSLSEEDCSAL